MKITFLGTGTSQGVPVIACHCRTCSSTDSRDNRLRSSLFVNVDNTDILIDIGPDFRAQMLANHIEHLDGVLITHAHRDHVAGMDDLRSYNFVQKKAIDIYSNSTAEKLYKQAYRYIFEAHIYPGLPEVSVHIVDGDAPFLIKNTEIIPIKVMHKDMPILGYRIGDIAYITDANHIEPQELAKMKDLSVLVINALRKEQHYSHFCLRESLEVIAAVKPKEAYLTHISHEMGLQCEVEKELPANVHFAYDNLSLEI